MSITFKVNGQWSRSEENMPTNHSIVLVWTDHNKSRGCNRLMFLRRLMIKTTETCSC